jgi:hypothetical protein
MPQEPGWAKSRHRVCAYMARGGPSDTLTACFETTFREWEAGSPMRGSTWQPQPKAGEGIRTLDIQLVQHDPQARVTAKVPLRHHQQG